VKKSNESSAGKEQLLLRHARREGCILMAVWLAALVWSVGVSYALGYNRDSTSIGLVLGFPDWVFWGIVVPWAVCLGYSVWFCFVTMADDDLGQDQEEKGGHG
jgi:Protein of unknown function (DUF997)